MKVNQEGEKVMEKWRDRGKKITAILLSLILILGAVDLSVFAVSAAETNYGTKLDSGDTGDCQWTVYDSDNDGTGDKLVISGEGAMGNREWIEPLVEIEPAPWGAFSQTIDTVVMEEGVVKTGMGIFCEHNNLTSVVIPDSLTEIVPGTFMRCAGLKSLTIPAGVVEIGASAFYESGLTSIEIPEGIETIRNSALYGCRDLKSVKLPQSLKAIEMVAFAFCSGLTSIEIPEGVEEIRELAFHECSGLESIKIPKGMCRIEWETFTGCTSLRTLVIPETVTSIARRAFSGCTSLESIDWTDSIRTIELEAFQGCTSLKSVELPKFLSNIETSAFSDCTSLVSVEIPEGMESVPAGMFAGCTSLTSVKIPEGVKQIFQQAFRGCNLTSVVIPESTTNIWDGAFKDCQRFENIIFKGKKCSYSHQMLSNTASNLTAYVPVGSSDYYDKLSQYGNPNITVTEYDVDFAQQPQNQSAVLGRSAKFSVVAEGSVAGEQSYDYQWQKQLSSGDWEDIPDANQDSYHLKAITASDIGKYRCVATMKALGIPLCSKLSQEAELVIGKVTPYLAEAPTATAITYGQKLNDSTLNGGKVQYSGDSSLEGYDMAVDGFFYWDHEETEKRPSAFTDSNQTEYRVIFQPADTSSYCSVETTVKVTVNKAPNTPGMPKIVMNVSEECAKVSDVPLSDNWQWQLEDAQKELERGVPLVVTAVYNGADKGNYQTEVVEISITRSECLHVGGTATCTEYAECVQCGEEYGSLDSSNHGETETRNVQNVTCIQNGYTGDICCTACEQIISKGTIIASAGKHIGGKATCAWRAVCERCGEEYGELDSEHKYKEIRDVKDVTCTEDGYTGNTYCTECGTKVAQGTVIKKKGHNYSVEIVRESTCERAGERIFTCLCGDQYRDGIPATSHQSEIRDGKEPTCTEEGHWGDTYCSVCGLLLYKGNSKPAFGHEYSSTVTKKPTRLEEGIRTYTCKRTGCKDTYTKPIPRLAAPKTGIRIKNTNLTYKVTKSDDKNGTVQFLKSEKTNLETAIIPAFIDIDGVKYKVTSIAANAFQNSRLKKAAIGNNVTTIGSNAFSGCKKLTTVIMGKKVKTIGKSAFSGCGRLKTLSLGANVTTINEKAFYQCVALTRITIPAKVNKIGKQGLQGCKKLKTITIKTKKLTNKNVGASAFKGIHAKAVINVPKSKVKSYQKLLKAKGIGSKVQVR